MASWQDEYLAALDERDFVEKANHSFYLAYTTLADRTARLDGSSAGKDLSAELASKAANLTIGKDKARPGGDQAADLNILLASVRQDLSEAQKMRAELQSRLDSISSELDILKAKSAADGKRIGDLSTERSQLQVRLRDRDEELRGKSKLLVNVQDEMVSLNLQLNMGDERNQKLRQENQDLIDRWMKRMGQEADAMNEARLGIKTCENREHDLPKYHASDAMKFNPGTPPDAI